MLQCTTALLNFSKFYFSYDTYQSVKEQYDMIWHQNRTYLSDTGVGEWAYREQCPFLQQSGGRQRKG